jgi:molybdenum cofactor cytidylyltransferase
MSPVGLILLAAGASTRLGRSKQLLIYQGKTLLRRAAESAVASPCRPVIVVTGALHAELLPELHDLDVSTEQNEDWPKGMGTSVRTGVRALHRLRPDAGAAVIMLCDQPFVTAGILRLLVDLHRAGPQAVIASAFAGTHGPPCLFPASWFASLLAMPDGQGAKPLLAQAAARGELISITFPEGQTDIDTMADFDDLT